MIALTQVRRQDAERLHSLDHLPLWGDLVRSTRDPTHLATLFRCFVLWETAEQIEPGLKEGVAELAPMVPVRFPGISART
jgi:hypothetical protein